MDGSGLGCGFLSGPTTGIIDLGYPIHRQQQSQLGHQPMDLPHHQLNMMCGVENDHHPVGSIQRGFSMNFGKGKAVCDGPGNVNTSEEDDEYAEDGNCDNFDGGKEKNGAPWQRMKWTDNVVRLLIAVVACVGDDGSFDGAEGISKRKSGILQKKGKWKTVSKIMISKGCHVSPQQCEDKFNDLNKRYKRLNEILGRGTSCRVVENPALMDSMPQLSEKMKDVVRKILHSKHLFYQEMCAYHNGQRIPNCHEFDLQSYALPIAICSKDNNNGGSEEEDAREHDDSEDDESDNENGNNGGRKRAREENNKNYWFQSDGHDSFEAQISEIFQDPSKSMWEQRDWIKNQMSQLQKQKVGCLAEAFELEKRRFKWHRFCSKKDRELERARLENERKKLENERMELLLKQKELELDFKRSEASVGTLQN